jgi:hypothetical protein
MRKKKRTAAEIASDSLYLEQRRKHDEASRATLKVRRLEALPLLDEISQFGIEVSELDELVDKPENFLALVIPVLLNYLDRLSDRINIQFLLMALTRIEARGVAFDRLYDFYSNCSDENLRFQACKALAFSATSCDADKLEAIILSPNISASEIEYLVEARERLQKLN